MKLLLVTLVVVTAIAVNICEIDAMPQTIGWNYGAERRDNVAPSDRHGPNIESAINVAPNAEGKCSIWNNEGFF